MMPGHCLFYLPETGHPAFGIGFTQVTAIAVGGMDLDAVEEERLVDLVEEIDAADAH